MSFVGDLREGVMSRNPIEMPRGPGAHGPNQRVFISHATEDQPYVRLIDSLLRVHDHYPWWSEQGEGDHEFECEVDRALRYSDALIVMVSEHAARSTWIAREVARFRSRKIAPHVVPLRLDAVDLACVSPELDGHRVVDCSDSLHAGFQELLATFGDGTHRSLARGPAAAIDRREGIDRRRSRLSDRMRIGFLVGYCRETGCKPPGEPDLSTASLRRLEAAMLDEASRYEYFDPATQDRLAPDRVLEMTIPRVWRGAPIKAQRDISEFLRDVAEDVCDRCDVRRIDRRKSTPRAAAGPSARPPLDPTH